MRQFELLLLQLWLLLPLTFSEKAKYAFIGCNNRPYIHDFAGKTFELKNSTQNSEFACYTHCASEHFPYFELYHLNKKKCTCSTLRKPVFIRSLKDCRDSFQFLILQDWMHEVQNYVSSTDLCKKSYYKNVNMVSIGTIMVEVNGHISEKAAIVITLKKSYDIIGLGLQFYQESTKTTIFSIYKIQAWVSNLPFEFSPQFCNGRSFYEKFEDLKQHFHLCGEVTDPVVFNSQWNIFNCNASVRTLVLIKPPSYDSLIVENIKLLTRDESVTYGREVNSSFRRVHLCLQSFNTSNIFVEVSGLFSIVGSENLTKSREPRIRYFSLYINGVKADNYHETAGLSTATESFTETNLVTEKVTLPVTTILKNEKWKTTKSIIALEARPKSIEMSAIMLGILIAIGVFFTLAAIIGATLYFSRAKGSVFTTADPTDRNQSFVHD